MKPLKPVPACQRASASASSRARRSASWSRSSVTQNGVPVETIRGGRATSPAASP